MLNFNADSHFCGLSFFDAKFARQTPPEEGFAPCSPPNPNPQGAAREGRSSGPLEVQKLAGNGPESGFSHVLEFLETGQNVERTSPVTFYYKGSGLKRNVVIRIEIRRFRKAIRSVPVRLKFRSKSTISVKIDQISLGKQIFGTAKTP